MKRPHMTRGFSRRRLLAGLGASAALSPLLPILNASGQETLFPKRLLLFFTPDGTASVDHGGMQVNWKPQGSETDFTLHYIHEHLEPFKSKLVFPTGMRFSAGGAGQEHAFGMSGLWSGASLNEPGGDANFDGGNGQRTGWGSGPSIDQIVAKASGPEAPYAQAADSGSQETLYRTLELGSQCQEPHSMHRMIYAGNDQPIHPEVNPRAAFDRLFANLDLDGSETPSPTTSAASLGRAQSLELLIAETQRLKNRIGSEEWHKVEAHLEGLHAIDSRIASTATTIEGCTAPPRDSWPEPRSQWENSETFPDESQAMMDIAAHALACDITRVTSVQLSRGFSNVVHSWAGASQGHHTVSHLDGDNTAQLQEIDRWYGQQFAYVLSKLDSISEGDGTLLDNTLVVWGREMAATNHRMQPAHFVMAGSARGALQTGRVLSYDREPHAKLLVSIAQLMGLDLNGVGDRDPDSGPLSGLV